MDLQQRISLYTPSSDTIALVCTTKIVFLVGIAGAGKDTLKKELLKKPDFQDIISHTTRAPRSNDGVREIDNVDYHFINDGMAISMIDSQDFIEVKLVHGTVYGTSSREVQKAHDAGKIAITDIDVQGIAEYKKLSPDVVAIFILPPNFNIWLERLQKRYETKEAFDLEWPKRRESAIKELTHALEVSYYHFIINDDLNRTIQVAGEIAHKADVFHRKDDEARLVARDILEEIINRS